MKKIIITIFAISIVLSTVYLYNDAELRWEVGKSLKIKEGTSPQTIDSNLKIEEVVTGANELTTFAFIDNDILYLEKLNGDIKLIKNSELQNEPLYHFDVYRTTESGLLGITTNENHVYVYVSESLDEKGEIPDKNNIYKFLWDDYKLTEKELVNTLPSRNCCHQGGYMTTSPDGKVFATIGDLENIREGTPGKLQNMIDGKIDDTSIIFQVEYDKNEISPMNSDDPFSHYHAIGIRNSFGLAFDPITGNLWDTENGQFCCDEINLVTPKFNSGWGLAMGFVNQKTIDAIPNIGNFEYSQPEFEWKSVVAPTAIAIPGNQWGDEYKNSLFAGDYINGIIYKFELNEDRTKFIFQDESLQDLILNDTDTYDEIIFGTGFGRISDMKFGPDGSLYVATHLSNGALFKISLK